MTAGTFARVPSALAEDTSVSDRAMRLYVVLASHAHNASRTCRLDRQTLATRAGMSVATSKRATAELIDAGWLRVDGDGGRGRWNTYTVMTNRLTSDPPSDETGSRVSHTTGSSVSHTEQLDVRTPRRNEERSLRSRSAHVALTHSGDNVNDALPAMPEQTQPIADRCVRLLIEHSAVEVPRNGRTRIRLRSAFERLSQQYDDETLLLAARELAERADALTPRAVETFTLTVARRRARTQQSNPWSALAADTFEQMRQQGWTPVAGKASGDDTH